MHTPEFLNIIVATGLSNHKLTLNVGVPIMLLSNIDQSFGMCNGTRLIITDMGKYVLEGNVISGTNVRSKVFILRLSNNSNQISKETVSFDNFIRNDY